MAAVVPRRHQLEQRSVEPLTLPEDAPELGGRSEPLARPEALPQTASRFRPFWRRRLSTRRPPCVRMRTRKPWVRFRLRLLGWNVLFMIEPRTAGASRAARKLQASRMNHEL
jgi:hypothetical protein